MSSKNIREKILTFMGDKGVQIAALADDSLLLEHIQSVDFMELIVHMESLQGKPLDLAGADITSIMTVGGFEQWVELSCA